MLHPVHFVDWGTDSALFPFTAGVSNQNLSDQHTRRTRTHTLLSAGHWHRPLCSPRSHPSPCRRSSSPCLPKRTCKRSVAPHSALSLPLAAAVAACAPACHRSSSRRRRRLRPTRPKGPKLKGGRSPKRNKEPLCSDYSPFRCWANRPE